MAVMMMMMMMMMIMMMMMMNLPIDNCSTKENYNYSDSKTNRYNFWHR